MRVLIAGAAGMLGRQVAKEFAKRYQTVYPLTRKELDITDFHAIDSILKEISPDLVVNCAAYNNVDEAETEVETAFLINGLAPRLLGLSCRSVNATLIHFSSDYIFNGQLPRPYLITDPPDPLNIYGTSKLIGENGVRESGCNYYIIRTSWLFGPNGKNFVDIILKQASKESILKVVDDQHGSPTYSIDLARAVADLSESGIYGTYHYTNSGITTRYDFAKIIIKTSGLKTKVEPCATSDLPKEASRPANSTLDLFPIINILGYTPPPWEDALERYIKNYHVINV